MGDETKTTIAAYDATDEAADGLALARVLADLNGSELVIARILGDVVQGPFPGAPVPDRAEERAVRERVRETRRAVLAAVPEASHAQIAPIIDHDLARGLHAFAEAEDPSVLVFGSTHLGELGRRLIGSQAEVALDGAPCPVAVAPPGFREHDELDPRRIAVAFDGSPTSRAALKLALDLAGPNDIPLRIVSVASEKNSEAAQRLLDETAAGLPPGLEAEPALLIGDPAGELLADAERNAGLLLAGSRGRGALQRVVLGSVSVQLIRRAPCPVVVVPPAALSSGDDRRPA
jgi:nucleotide-binding universal stress UspA family protein